MQPFRCPNDVWRTSMNSQGTEENANQQWLTDTTLAPLEEKRKCRRDSDE